MRLCYVCSSVLGCRSEKLDRFVGCVISVYVDGFKGSGAQVSGAQVHEEQKRA